MPEFHYWFSGPAIFLAGSFAITLIIGLIPMMEGEKRWLVGSLLVIGLALTIVGWWVAAKQDQTSDKQASRLIETQISLRKVQGQVADLVLKMNRVMNGVPNQEWTLLARDTPKWLRIAHQELGQREVPGPEENHRIVQYFSTIGAKQYRDDKDDWASAFVQWSFAQVAIEGPKNDDPFAWLEWGQKLQKPSLGCVVVMSFSGLRHVGFYFGEEGDFVLVLGGNEDDAVHIFRYPRTSVRGYRWPSGLKLPDGN